MHTSPIACCAAVGGHGYSAASAVGLFPAVSVAAQVPAAGAGPHGGPTVPCTTLKVAEIEPESLTVTSADNDGALQLTEIMLLTRPPTMTLGCLASLLHSRTFPSDLGVKPVPAIVTVDPSLRPVSGVIVIGTLGFPAANADTWPATIVSPATKNEVAPTTRNREIPRRCPRGERADRQSRHDQTRVTPTEGTNPPQIPDSQDIRASVHVHHHY